VPRPEKPRPQPDLTLSIAGERLAVQGASIRSERGKRYLRLTRAAHACRSACAEGYDFYLDLALTGTPPKAAFVSLQGDMFPGAPAGSDGKEQFSVKLAPEFDSSGNAEASDAKASNAKARDAKARDATAVVEVQLDGSLTAQGYQVMLKGKASALHCGPITPSR